MKKLILILVAFNFSLTYLSAQIDWEQANGPFGGQSHEIATGDSGLIFAIYGEAELDSTVFALYRSFNFGDTWTRLDLSGTTLYNVEVSDSGYVFAFFEHSILRSTDNGDSWNEVFVTDGRAPTTFVNSTQGKLFAGGDDLYMSLDNGATWSLKDTSYSNLVAINSQGHLLRVIEPGLYLSEDDGSTWTLITDIGFIGFGIESMAINAADEILLGSNWDGLYKISADGSAWVQLNNMYDISEIGITASGNIYINTYISRLWASYDGGVTWVYQNEGLSTLTIPDIESNNEGYVYVSTEEGVYRSEDDGYTWHPANTGILLANVTAVISDPNSILYAAVRTGVFTSSDNGESWERIYSLDYESTVESINTDSEGNLYVIQSVTRYDKGDISDSCNFYYCHRLFRTSDNGATWIELFNAGAIGNIDFTSDGHLYVASSLGLMRSTDDGSTWEQVYDSSSIIKVAIDTSDNIYLLSDNLYRSEDFGETWDSFPLEPGNYIDLQTNKSGSLYAHSYLYDATASTHILEVSHNLGQTWTTLSSQDTSIIFNLFIGKFDYVYLATSTGLYRSTNLGQDFIDISEELPVRQVRDVAEDPNGNLFAAARERSLWKSGTYVNTSQIPTSNVSMSVYPNPTSGLVTVQYDGLIPSQLIIFNNLGKAIKYIDIDQPLTKVNTNGLVPGIYFLKITGRNIVRKMVVYSAAP